MNKKKIKKLHLKPSSTTKENKNKQKISPKHKENKNCIALSNGNLPELQLPKDKNLTKHKKSASSYKANEYYLPNIETNNKAKPHFNSHKKTNNISKDNNTYLVNNDKANKFQCTKIEAVPLNNSPKYSKNVRSSLNLNILLSSKNSYNINPINRINSTSNIFSHNYNKNFSSSKIHLALQNNPISLNYAPKTSKVTVKTIAFTHSTKEIFENQKIPNKDLQILEKDFNINNNIFSGNQIINHNSNNLNKCNINLLNNKGNQKELKEFLESKTIEPYYSQQTNETFSQSTQPKTDRSQNSLKPLNNSFLNNSQPPNHLSSQQKAKIKQFSSLLSYDSLSSYKIPYFLSSIQVVLSSNNYIPVLAYASNTHNGAVRSYNEDKITTLPFFNNMAYYFAIYDGHGGNKCSTFLQSELHFYFTNITSKPSMENSILRCENDYLSKIAVDQKGSIVDKSGSCAVIVIITQEKKIIFINIGDSRAILISSDNQIIFATEDHKPNSPKELERIVRAGGSIYQNVMSCPMVKNGGEVVKNGPFRVSPGRLSVSRTLGDIEIKKEKYGGNKNIIIPNPDITVFEGVGKGKFLVLGCDGIFDVLSNEEIIEVIQEAKEKSGKTHYCDLAADLIIKAAMLKNSFDNVSCIVIELKNDDL